MSWRACNWAVSQQCGGAPAKLILLLLANRADENDTCFPSQSTLSREAEITERSVRDQLSKLEDLGLIERFNSRGPDGLNQVTRYRLLIDNHRNEVPIHRNEVPLVHRNVVPHPPENHDTNHRNVVPPNHQLEPSIEPILSDLSKNDKTMKAHVEELWLKSPRSARQRSSKADVERSMRAALNRGHDLARVVAGVLAYYETPDAKRDGGAFAKGVHRIIENDRWMEFAPPTASSFWRPIEARQIFWMEQWVKNPSSWKVEDQGPRPGEPGCLVSPHIQTRFGVAQAANAASDREGRLL